MATAKRTSSANGNGGGKWITPKRRLATYLRDGFKCAYCLRDLTNAKRFDVTLDHLTCRTSGAPDHRSCNLITACRGCNSERQDKPLAAFCGAETRAYIRRQTRKSMRRFLELAQALLDGTAGAGIA